MQFCNLMWIVVRLDVIPYVCRLTTIHAFSHCCNNFWTRKKINLSGIISADLNRPGWYVMQYAQVQRGGGLDESRAARFLSAKPNESSSTSQRLIFTYLTHNTQHFPKGFSKSLRLKSFTPKNLKIEGYSTDMLQPREIMATPRCSPRAAEFPTSVTFLHCRQFWSYGVSNFPNFRIMAYFPIQHS